MIAPLTPRERDEALLLLRRAKEEDGPDVTSEAILADDIHVEGDIRAREACLVAGMPVAELLCRDSLISLKALVEDGTTSAAGAVIARVSGGARRVMGAERMLLNFLGRLSGIATLTRRYVEAFRPTPIYDTRKTTPGWRWLEKYAVRVGGGMNHRFGLADQILIKDNHLTALGRGAGAQPIGPIIRQALRFREKHPQREWLKVEVEVENEQDFHEAVEAGAHIVMLDNWTTEKIRTALTWLHKKGPAGIEIEISGGVTLDRGPELGRLGADRISVGALTHAARAIDFSMEL